jgi:MoxR-like ATPase
MGQTILSNLPTDIAPYFIGREAILQQLSGALRAGHTHAITGPAGIGKTRTSLELARRCANGVEGYPQDSPTGMRPDHLAIL